MESRTFFVLLSVFLSSFLISSSQAYDFYVGGRDGWVLKPSESYDHWARRLRFQVNDTLVFKYNRGSDSVLVVSKQNFDTCSNRNPVLRLDDGESRYKLENSGPFYFITGNQTNCQNGQKLILIVLAPRTKKAPVPSAPATPPSTAPAPAPATPPSTTPATPPSTAPETPPGTAPETPPGTAPATPPSSAPATPPSTAPTSPPNSSPPAPATPPGSSTPVSAPPPVEASPPSGGTPSDGSAAPGGDSGQSPPPPQPSSSTMLTASMGFTLACSLLITMARV